MTNVHSVCSAIVQWMTAFKIGNNPIVRILFDYAVKRLLNGLTEWFACAICTRNANCRCAVHRKFSDFKLFGEKSSKTPFFLLLFWFAAVQFIKIIEHHTHDKIADLSRASTRRYYTYNWQSESENVFFCYFYFLSLFCCCCCCNNI